MLKPSKKSIAKDKLKALQFFVEKEIIACPKNITEIKEGYSKPLKIKSASKTYILKYLKDSKSNSKINKYIVNALSKKFVNHHSQSLFINLISQRKVGDKLWQLTEFSSEGQKTSDCIVNYNFRDNEIAYFAQLLAEIHKEIQYKCDAKKDDEYYIFNSHLQRRIVSVAKKNKTKAVFMKKEKEYLLEQLMKKNYPSGFNINFYHGDLHRQNMFWGMHEGKMLPTKIFDCEFVYVPRIFDLVMPIIDIVNNINYSDEVPSADLLMNSKTLFFLKNYGSQSLLSKFELKAIPLFFSYFLLIFYSLKTESPAYLKKIEKEIFKLKSQRFRKVYEEKINAQF